MQLTFAIRVRCANHLAQLLFKDSIKEIPQLWEITDSVDSVWTFFTKSVIAAARLRERISDGETGIQRPKRSKHLTRWTALFEVCLAMIALHKKLVNVCVDMINDKKMKSAMKTWAKTLLSRWCSYKSVCTVVLLKHIAEYFRDMHLILQKRKCDFTSLPNALETLEQKIDGLLTPEFIASMCSEDKNILSNAKTVPEIAETQQKLDVFLRESTTRATAMPKYFSWKMSKDSCEILKEFEIFDIE